MNLKINYTFTGVLEDVKISFIRTVVFIPQDIIVTLPRGRKKITGLMNGAPFSLTIQYKKDGTQFFAVSNALREAAAVKPGEPVRVVFSILATQVAEIPATHETRLLSDDDAARVWNGFTEGLQNGLTHYVNTAKKLDSRIRKSFEWVEKSRASTATQPLKRRKTRN